MEKDPLNKKIEFIREHAEQIVPVLADEKEKEEVKKLSELSAEDAGLIAGPEEEKSAEQILEKFETKIFLIDKKDGQFDPEAKKILFGVSHPLPFSILRPMLERLKGDSRCRSIGLMMDNVAGVNLEKLLSEWQMSSDLAIKSFKGGKTQQYGEEAEGDKNYPVLADALKTAQDNPYDVALMFMEGRDSPVSPLFFGAKSNFGAKKSYLMFDGWTSITLSRYFLDNENSEPIDGVFCNDELAKKILLAQLPQILPEKVFITGSPVTDSLEIDKAFQYRETGRRKLHLADGDLAILYLGDVSGGLEYEAIGGIDSLYNEKTAQKTARALVSLAAKEPQKNYALLVRPHPRDPNKDALLKMAEEDLAPNLKILAAGRENVSMQEALYAADAIASIISTENFLAPLRGKKAIFLSYDDKGLGNDILSKMFGPALIKTISEDKNISFISSEAELVETMGQPEYFEPHEAKAPVGNSIEKIMNIIFEEKKSEIA